MNKKKKEKGLIIEIPKYEKTELKFWKKAEKLTQNKNFQVKVETRLADESSSYPLGTPLMGIGFLIREKNV